ncbi:hypothetical protein CHS0354_027677 [Potamilus streckersoni]|uniref:Uncharacterized protein n=1 Tax=Potamilus streckersoni TaxID=2493646 RepID=A0AAE0T0G4_9BIVA|nr:hypothetical protein CHS0354_027677 [Potamilus streckersoni]
MELGLDFDDEDFENKEKQASVPVSYNAKFSSPLWFLSATAEDTDSVAQIRKFKGDNFFYLGNYREAAEAYRACLDVLPENNKIMQREVSESLARCFLHLGEAEKALKLAEELQKNCMTVDQNLQVLCFFQQIYRTMDRIDDEIAVLHQLILLHHFNVQFWVRLASAYEKLISIKPSADSDDVQILHGEGLHIDLKIVTCFIRVRLLLRSCYHSVGSFIRLNNNQLLEQMEEKIQKYCLDERLLAMATECLKRDLLEQEGSTSHNESKKGDLSDLTLRIKTSEVTRRFENQWFVWIERAKGMIGEPGV